MTNELRKKWTEEDLELARFISRSRKWPELTGEEQKVNYAILKRFGFEDKLEWERPRLRLYGDIYVKFEPWLFKQANLSFWCELEDLGDALMTYFKETSTNDKPSEEDCKKFDDVMAELKQIGDLPEMTYCFGHRGLYDGVETIRKDAQTAFFSGVAKKAFLDGIITLEEVKEIYKFEFLERDDAADWVYGWSMAGAIVTLRQIQENKKNGLWEGDEE